MIIPPQVFILITGPGIVLHEIAHRFMCDIYNIPVYEINYLSIEEDYCGRVMHQKIDNFFQDFFIGFAPLFFNSCIAMFLLIPLSVCAKSDFLMETTFNYFTFIMYYIASWIGLMASFHAMPSNTDVKNLLMYKNSKISKKLIGLLVHVVALFNLDFVGSIMRSLYTMLLMKIITLIFI